MTISTKQHPFLERFVKSAEAHGFKPKIFGLKENKQYHDPLIGVGHFGMKLRYLLEYARMLKPDDILLYSDAWDAIIINDCDKILKDYKSFKKDIVFGAEFAIANWHDLFNMYKYDLTKPFSYLCAGVMIGRAGTIKDLLEKYTDVDIKDTVDDQVLWRKIYLENKNKICLDTHAKLILNTCLTNKTHYIYVDNVFTYTRTNTNPSIIHAQGPEKLGFKSYLDLIKY